MYQVRVEGTDWDGGWTLGVGSDEGDGPFGGRVEDDPSTDTEFRVTVPGKKSSVCLFYTKIKTKFSSRVFTILGDEDTKTL